MREEGRYKIARVDKLPIRGNANYLYSIKDANEMTMLHRYRPNGTYEEIPIGTGVSFDILAYPVENTYADSANMFGDQGNQTIDFFQYVTDIDTYYQYLGTTTGDITDYRELTADEVTVINGRTLPPVDNNYADLATLYLLANQRQQRTGWIYRVDADNSFYEYLGTRNGDATDYINVTGAISSGLEALNEGNGIGYRLIGGPAANYGNIGFGSTDLSESTGASSINGPTADNCFMTGKDNSILSSVVSNILGAGCTMIGGGFGSASTVIGSANNTYEWNFASLNLGYLNDIGTSGSTGGSNPVIWYSGALGYACNVYGGRGTWALGSGLDHGGAFCTVVGAANVDLTAVTADQNWSPSNSTLNPGFVVGIGTVNSSNPAVPTFVRKNGFVVWRDGTAELPEGSVAEIDTRGVKSIPTLEWYNAQRADNKFVIQANADITAQIDFDASAITTATTRTITMPDTNVDLADIAANTARHEIKNIKVSLTAGQINAIGTTPIDAIATPGAGKIIKVLGAIAVNTFAAVAADSNTLHVRVDGATNPLFTFSTGLLDAVATETWDSDKGAVGPGDLIAATKIVIDGTDSVAVYDGTVDIYITYEEITL